MKLPKVNRALVTRYGGAVALAIAVIGGFEGVRTVTYRDVVGVPTVCFGETRGVKMGDRYTLEQCHEMLGDGVVEFEQGIDKCLRAPATIPAPTKAAYLSVAWNIGVGAFCKSSIRVRWNSGDLAGSCDALRFYDKARVKGVLKPLPGLTRRRAEERELCRMGLPLKQSAADFEYRCAALNYAIEIVDRRRHCVRPAELALH